MVLQRFNGNTDGLPPPPQSLVSDKPSKHSHNRTEREIKITWHQNPNENPNDSNNINKKKKSLIIKIHNNQN